MDKLKVGLEIINKLNLASFEAYIVGGAVRDYLMGNPIYDVDIATNAKPTELLSIFENVNLDGQAYFSAKVYFKSFTFEVTTFRKDISYLDHRHPKIEVVHTIEEDLARRDFTMNALAMDKNLKILDFYNGEMDIKNKQIKMIGAPEIRFEEDALRVLRAIEFSSRFNFALEEQILKSFSKDFLKPLHEEYIVSMLERIMKNPYSIGRKYLTEYKLLKSFPFYQVVCDETLLFNYPIKPYALFYSIHNFLPSNCKLANQVIKEAKDIAYFVRNAFSNESLFYGNLTYLKDAINIYNVLHKSKLNEEEIKDRYKNLPLHSLKELNIDIKKLPVQRRSIVQKEFIKRILNGELSNNKEDLNNLIEQGNKK